MSNADNQSHREYCVEMLQWMDSSFRFVVWNYLQFRAILISQIHQTDALDGQRRGHTRDERDQDDHEDAYMEDVVMGGTSPD